MNENSVTKPGRPRKYQTNAERQWGYRQRKAIETAEEERQLELMRETLESIKADLARYVKGRSHEPAN